MAAEQEVATNRLPAASRKLSDNITINPQIGARSLAACGSLWQNSDFR